MDNIQYSESQVIIKWLEKIKRGFLWITILKLYDEKVPLSGTDLKNKINEMHQNWDPSPGSIYPILRELEKDRLIVKDENHTRNKAYSITETGSKLLISLRNEIFAFRIHPMEFIKRMERQEEEFKHKFSDMYSNFSKDDLELTKKHFQKIIGWLDGFIFEKDN